MSRKQLIEMGWPDVEEYLRSDDRAILPLGSIEQHGRHLTFVTDSMIAEQIALRASDATGVLVIPTQCYGMSLHHLDFPGSIGLRPETLMAVLADVLESLYYHGFRRVLIINGHGGNIAPMKAVLINVLNDRPDFNVLPRTWSDYPSVKPTMDELWPGQRDSHSGPGETSLVMALWPEVVRMDRAQYSPDAPEMMPVLTRTMFKQDYPHGVIGSDPKLGSAEKGKKMLDTIVADCVAELNKWEPRPGAKKALSEAGSF